MLKFRPSKSMSTETEQKQPRARRNRVLAKVFDGFSKKPKKPSKTPSLNLGEHFCSLKIRIKKNLLSELLTNICELEKIDPNQDSNQILVST